MNLIMSISTLKIENRTSEILISLQHRETHNNLIFGVN